MALSLASIAVLTAALAAPPLLGVGWGARKLEAVYRDTRIPKPAPLFQTTYFYDRHGRLITTLRSAVNRTVIPFGQMPAVVQHAVVAAEDEDYWREGGISFPAILRAALYNLVHGGFLQGGSTITQQYVKDVYTGGKRSLARKIREAIIAQKLSRRFSKKEILARYLNEVYFGHTAYGVQAAAQTYFGVDARNLDLNQAATLAGIIAAPGRFDPIAHPEAARDRRDYVLDRMVEHGSITPVEAVAVKREPVGAHLPQPLPIPGQYFLDFVKKELERRFGTARTFGGGLRVQTTLDVRLQRAARSAVNAHLSTPGDPSAAMVVMDPRTGEVLAMIGGRSRKKTKFNLATQARRQAGSAFKVFTLTAAVEQGISLDSVWEGPSALLVNDERCFTPDPETKVPGPWNVSNYGDESEGTMTLADATAYSVNTIFSQLVLDVGPDRVAEMAHRMGVRSDLAAVCSITLGTQGVTPMDMTTGYATLAARGVRHWPIGVQEVKGPKGDVVWSPDHEGTPVVSTNVADVVTSALQGVIDHGTGTAANIGRPAAGKTGTAQSYQDAWFCGYVPQLVACVWVGYPEGEIPLHNVEGFPNVFGGSIPALIWHDFMAQALQDYPVRYFAPPDLSGFETTPPGSVGAPEKLPVERTTPDVNQSSG